MILSLSKITIKIENFKFEMLPARWLRYSKLFSFYLFKGFLFVMCFTDGIKVFFPCRKAIHLRLYKLFTNPFILILVSSLKDICQF